MRYSQIRAMDISNGTGIGVSLFVQGCHFHCKNCFNSDTWNFNGGKEWNENLAKAFISIASKDYIQRISILGGEPLENCNISELYALIKRIKVNYPDKKIWLYTGFIFEDIFFDIDKENIGKRKIISLCDVVVDGQYIDDLKDQHLLFRGSSNQRIIDVPKSLKQNKVVLWKL